MSRTSIDPETYGSADFVTEIRILKSASWGGFEIDQVTDERFEDFPGAIILIRARSWTGIQPRMFLVPTDSGYDDWRKILNAAPESRRIVRVVGSREAARNLFSQWATHGPSKLLGGKKWTSTPA